MHPDRNIPIASHLLRGLLVCAFGALPLVAQQASSSSDRGTHMNLHVDADSVAHVVSRVPLARASYAITSDDGRSALLLMDTTIVAELTDRGLAGLHQSMDSSARSDGSAGVMARMIAGAVAGALEPVFDHGIAYHLRDLRSAKYESGRLVLRGKSGKEAFGQMDINGRNVMETFSASDAKEFARRALVARDRLD